jgi:hypothetical protein
VSSGDKAELRLKTDDKRKSRIRWTFRAVSNDWVDTKCLVLRVFAQEATGR